jgi:hypothetical protein
MNISDTREQRVVKWEWLRYGVPTQIPVTSRLDAFKVARREPVFRVGRITFDAWMQTQLLTEEGADMPGYSDLSQLGREIDAEEVLAAFPWEPVLGVINNSFQQGGWSTPRAMTMTERVQRDLQQAGRDWFGSSRWERGER